MTSLNSNLKQWRTYPKFKKKYRKIVQQSNPWRRIKIFPLVHKFMFIKYKLRKKKVEEVHLHKPYH